MLPGHPSSRGDRGPRRGQWGLGHLPEAAGNGFLPCRGRKHPSSSAGHCYVHCLELRQPPATVRGHAKDQVTVLWVPKGKIGPRTARAQLHHRTSPGSADPHTSSQERTDLPIPTLFSPGASAQGSWLTHPKPFSILALALELSVLKSKTDPC